MSPSHGPHGHGRVKGEKPKSFGTAWKKLFSYLGKHRIAVWAAMIFAFVGTALTLIGPNKLRDLTDLVKEGLISGVVDMGAVWEIGVFLIAIYAVSGILSLVENYIMATVSQKTASRLRTDISKKINRLPLK